MKILWVLENYHPKVGGVETLFKTLEAQLLEKGHSLTIITTQSDQKEPFKTRKKGLTLIRTPFQNRFLFTFVIWPLVWWHSRKADLVHTTSYNAGLPALIGAKLSGRKILITFHEVWGNLWFHLPFLSSLQSFLFHRFERLLLLLPFSKFVAVSGSTAHSLRENGIPREKIEVIFNGIDYHDFTMENSGSHEKGNVFEFTFFGRSGVSKGLDLILPAFQNLSKRQNNLKLKLILPKTDNRVSKWVKAYIKENSLENEIQVQNHLDFGKLKKALMASNCILIPSYSEGFCFAAVESMALGTPLISSDRFALKEVVGGKMVAMQEQSVTGLEEAMEKAIRGEWEVRTEKRFPLQDTVNAYEALYQQFCL